MNNPHQSQAVNDGTAFDRHTSCMFQIMESIFTWVSEADVEAEWIVESKKRRRIALGITETHFRWRNIKLQKLIKSRCSLSSGSKQRMFLRSMIRCKKFKDFKLCFTKVIKDRENPSVCPKCNLGRLRSVYSDIWSPCNIIRKLNCSFVTKRIAVNTHNANQIQSNVEM